MLIDSSGNQVTTPEVEGLLTYNGGTVCDDSFDGNALDAVCKELGFTMGSSFTNRADVYGSQARMSVNMDEIQCSSTSWSSCSYTLTSDCGHGEDLVLTCLNLGSMGSFTNYLLTF